MKCNGITSKKLPCKFNASDGHFFCMKHLKGPTIKDLEDELRDMSLDEFRELHEQAETPPSEERLELMKQTKTYLSFLEK